jgi:iron-sulfur cluster assembly protein
MIEVSEKARQKLKELGVGDGSYLKIEVISGGCAGMKYDASIVSAIEGKDELISDFEDDIDVVSDPKSSLFIDGLNIDFSDDLIQSGFILTNKGNSQSCGCGASFQV